MSRARELWERAVEHAVCDSCYVIWKINNSSEMLLNKVRLMIGAR